MKNQQKNQQKKLNSVIIFIAILLTFIFVSGESKAFALTPATSITTAAPVAPATVATTKPVTTSASGNSSVTDDSKESSVKTPQSIPEKNKHAIKQMKENGVQHKLLKFFTAMAGVLISSLAIFLGLKFYKKLALKNYSKIDTIDYEKNLESPKDFREAINLFLDKTDK